MKKKIRKLSGNLVIASAAIAFTSAMVGLVTGIVYFAAR